MEALAPLIYIVLASVTSFVAGYACSRAVYGLFEEKGGRRDV